MLRIYVCLGQDMRFCQVSQLQRSRYLGKLYIMLEAYRIPWYISILADIKLLTKDRKLTAAVKLPCGCLDQITTLT